MRAIVFAEYGSPKGLRLADVPIPRPGDHQVLVRVRASSINSWDWEFLHGEPFINRLMFGLLRPKLAKRTLGADIAGTVEEVGRSVTRFRPGDEVFGDLWDAWGGFAEYACAHESGLEATPENATFEEAAAVPQAGVLALQGLRSAGPIQPGQHVLINGAGGGVGTFAIQIAKLAGAEVTGVDASHKLEAIHSVGADHAIDYGREDFTAIGERYDLIVDCQNLRSMSDNKRALKPGGTYAMVGGARILPLLLTNLWASVSRETRRFQLVAAGPNKGLEELRKLVQAGELVPVIDRTYSLPEVPEALTYFGTGRHCGKIAISIDGP